MHRQLQQEAPEEEILEAMRMADKEQKGFILVSELRAKLTGLGEKLSDREGESSGSSVFPFQNKINVVMLFFCFI